MQEMNIFGKIRQYNIHLAEGKNKTRWLIECKSWRR